MSLQHADYFKLKPIKAQKTEKEILTFPQTVYKNLDGGSVPEIEPFVEISAKNMG